MNYIQEKTSKVGFYTSLKDVARWLEINLNDFYSVLSNQHELAQEFIDRVGENLKKELTK